MNRLALLFVACLVSAPTATVGGPAAALATPTQRESSPEPQASGYQTLTPEQAAEVRALFERFKQDPRGPYLRIRWFCNDGTVLPPTPSACGDHGGGHQHAEFKPEASALADLGFHVGTILRATSFREFLDREHAHYRLRELVVEHHLGQYGDGWVLRRARYYRGARQIEDEERRGRQFLERLLANQEWRASNPLLATQLAAVVPHGQPGIPGERIRAIAARVAELDDRFQNLRIKIHSRPGPEDLTAVQEFRDGLPSGPAAELESAVEELEASLAALYSDAKFPDRLRALAGQLRATALAGRVEHLAEQLVDADARARVTLLSDLLREARHLFAQGTLPEERSGGVSLAVLDLINYADGLLTTAANAWLQEEAKPLEFDAGSQGTSTLGSPLGAKARPGADELVTRADLLGFLIDLLGASYATGLLYEREYEALRDAAVATLEADANSSLTAAAYHDRIQYLGHAIDWANAAIQQTFGMVIERYSAVEPLVRSLGDAALRSSVLLPYGIAIDRLSRDAGSAVSLLHSIFDVEPHTGIIGLNSGVAVGRLAIIDDLASLSDLDPDGIYVLPETPSELGRVGGILTLEEGSPLSHVQLLVRSLGLPNSVISASLLPELRQHEGERVFYAVSPLGTVLLKPMEALTDQDLAILGERTSTRHEQFAVDESKLDLSVTRVLPLDEIDLDDSGRIVGPKAANLGRLHRLFPQRVAPGLVIPFGVFRQHIDRDVEGRGQTLYEELVEIYDTAEGARAAGGDEATINRRLLGQLEEVRKAIIGMDFIPEFEGQIRAALRQRFGPDGTYGVFVRSDTNVEDLPNFTGAGLNLTVMNQIGTAEILTAIKRVWASPFAARSYTWRQRLLSTPESVYPSVLLLRSVPVDASGVLATIDLTRGERGYWTVTLAEGIGAVVEGEAAETMLVPLSGDPPMLLSSARAVWQKVLRMAGSGGVEKVPVRGDPVLLTTERLSDLRLVTTEILRRFPPVLDEDGNHMPWDIEFGFLGDRAILFQIRPFVDNRQTKMLRGLAAMDSAVLESGRALLALDEPPTLTGTNR